MLDKKKLKKLACLIFLCGVLRSTASQSSPFEFNPEALLPVAQDLGLNAGANAATAWSNAYNQGTSIHYNAKASDAAVIIGGILLGKGLYEIFYGSNNEKDNVAQNILKLANTQGGQNGNTIAQEFTSPSSSSFFQENKQLIRNVFGSVLGLILLLNKQIGGYVWPIPKKG